MAFRIIFTCETTEGPRPVSTGPIDTWDETAAQLDGMVAAVGPENVKTIRITNSKEG